MTEDKREEFERLVKPLIHWLGKNCNPHCAVIIDSTTAELLHGVMCCSIDFRESI